MLSTVKDRVLEMVVSKGIEREKFFSELGVSYSNFRGIQKKSALSSDVIAKILSLYPDVSPSWLLTGEGEMLLNELKPINKNVMKDQELIDQLKSEISELKENLKFYREMCRELQEEKKQLFTTNTHDRKKKEAI